jgi:hypothetical protein
MVIISEQDEAEKEKIPDTVIQTPSKYSPVMSPESQHSPNYMNMLGRLGPFEHTINSGTNPMKDVITVTEEGSVSNSVGESSIERIFEPKV